jgi:hypothetical protein
MPSGKEDAADAAAVLRAIPGHVDATQIRSSAKAAIRTVRRLVSPESKLGGPPSGQAPDTENCSAIE